MLAGALFFQYVVGLAPCELCIWQRWPHLAAVILGLVVWFVPSAWLMALGALAAATSGGLGIYHTGVERGWWPGPDSCTSAPVAGLTPEQLMERILAAPLVRCDEVPWEMLGLSMASWNAVASAGLALVWLLAANRAGRR